MENDLRKYLKRYFGFDDFRTGQLEIIKSLIDGNDTLAVMPTGGGKSLCYQLPAVIAEGTAIVISPLIALMKDQVDALLQKNISATYINSSLNYHEIAARIENAKSGIYELLYIAPERLEQTRFISDLKQIQITFIAVDEAHCVSEWGHDFRPSYLKIKSALKYLPDLPVISLTATATPKVQDDIIESLELNNCKKYVKGFDRKNLTYITEKTNDKISRLVEILSESKSGSNIIYCASRKKVESVSQGLNAMGFQVLAYHAGFHDNYRKYTQERFIRGEVNTIVATNAFGMGIDKPDVRNVIHMDMTQTLEAYYQEAGRAGRDGLESNCYMLYHPDDRKLQMFFIHATYPEKREIELVYEYLFDLYNTSIGEKCYEPINPNINEMGNKLGLSSMAVHSAIQLLKRNDIIKSTTGGSKAKIQFVTSRERVIQLYENLIGNEKQILEAVLRGISGDVFEREVEFDVLHLLKKYELNIDDFDRLTRKLKLQNIARYTAANKSSRMFLIKERESFKYIHIDFEAQDKRKKNAILKLWDVKEYAETNECKRNYILNYFKDEDYDGVCGKCSSCNTSTEIKKEIDSKTQFLERTILEACTELDNSFGKTNLSAYLKGSSNPAVKKHNLSRGKYFGSCKEFTLDEIKQGIEKAVFKSKLNVSSDRYSILSVNPNNSYQFNYVTKLSLKNIKNAYDREFFKELKTRRKQLAVKQRIIESGIISESMLKKIATFKPISIEQMKTINGLTSSFIDSFGKYFLLNIEVDFSTNAKLDENICIICDTIRKKKLSLDSIAKKMKLDIVTTAKYISEALDSGEGIDVDYWFDSEDIEKVIEIVNSKPYIKLRQLKDKYKFDISYPMLRVLLAVARRKVIENQ